MASTSDIRKGFTLRFNNDIYSIVEFLHVKPGKGAAFVRTKLKSLTNGKVLENTFPSGAKLEEVRVERKTYQYLYPEGDIYNFMDQETFDQIPIQADMIPNARFLMDGAVCDLLVESGSGKILTVELPQFIIAEVTYTEPGLKGDTATNTLKPATVSTGAEVKVPLFIDIGDKIKIDTTSGSYMERVKE